MCGHHGNRSARIYANQRSMAEYISLLVNDFEFKRMMNFHSTTLKKQKGAIKKCRAPCVGNLGEAEEDLVVVPRTIVDDGVREVGLTLRDAFRIALRIKGKPQTEANIDKMLNRKRQAIKDWTGSDGRTFKTTSRYSPLYKKRRVTKADIDRISRTYGTHSRTGNTYLIIPYYETDASDEVLYMIQWRERRPAAATNATTSE